MHALPRAPSPSRPRPLHQQLLVLLRPRRHPPPRAHPPQRPRPDRHLSRPRLPHRRQPPHRSAPATPAALFLGIYSHHQLIDTIDLTELIGISFHPGGTVPFFPDNTHTFTNRETSLEDLWGRAALNLRNDLREASTPAQKFDLLDFALRHRLTESRTPRRTPTIDYALDPPPTLARHHHHQRTHPRHRHQPPPPLATLPRTHRRLSQTLLPHPALPAGRPAHAPRRRHPLDRTSPHLRLLRPVPLRQRLPRLLRPQPHPLLHHTTPLGQPHPPRLTCSRLNVDYQIPPIFPRHPLRAMAHLTP